MSDDCHIGQRNSKITEETNLGCQWAVNQPIPKAMFISEKVKRNIAHIDTIYDQTPQSLQQELYQACYDKDP